MTRPGGSPRPPALLSSAVCQPAAWDPGPLPKDVSAGERGRVSHWKTSVGASALSGVCKCPSLHEPLCQCQCAFRDLAQMCQVSLLSKVLGPLWGTEGPKTQQACGHVLPYFPPPNAPILRGSTIPDVPRGEDGPEGQRGLAFCCPSPTLVSTWEQQGWGGEGDGFPKRLLLPRGQHPAHTRQHVREGSQPEPLLWRDGWDTGTGAQPPACLQMTLANNL